MMRSFFLVLASILVWHACAVPFPTPQPEAIVACNITNNITNPCGDNGQCTEFKCTCDPKYGTLDAAKPCANRRTSKLLVFLLQIFLGFAGISAMILGWWWYAVAIYIVYVSICLFTFFSAYTKDTQDKWGLCFVCGNCTGTLTVLGIWIATLVYIVNDCYSVEDNMSLKCWDNL